MGASLPAFVGVDLRETYMSNLQTVQELYEAVGRGDIPGGEPYRDEEIHLWDFNDEGLITRLRHYTDTAKQMRAAGVAVP
jgi:ketosteroid isomerase-like protein